MYNFRPNQVGYRMGALSPTDLIIAQNHSASYSERASVTLW